MSEEKYRQQEQYQQDTPGDCRYNPGNAIAVEIHIARRYDVTPRTIDRVGPFEYGAAETVVFGDNVARTTYLAVPTAWLVKLQSNIACASFIHYDLVET